MEQHDAIKEQGATQRANYPTNWMIASDFDPNDHLMNLKGRDYLNVQSRLLWFIRDQRALIAAGLAREPYIVRTELVELDREAGWAHFKTTVRDVLGNESVMYGSEASKDFGDFIEKASTKSLGRALLTLGYGTAFAPEMDEGDRVVDSPVERRQAGRPRNGQTPAMSAQRQRVIRETPAPVAAPVAPAASLGTASAHSVHSVGDEATPTEQQLLTIRKLSEALHRPEPEAPVSYAQASQVIAQLNGDYQRVRRAS